MFKYLEKDKTVSGESLGQIQIIKVCFLLCDAMKYIVELVLSFEFSKESLSASLSMCKSGHGGTLLVLALDRQRQVNL